MLLVTAAAQNGAQSTLSHAKDAFRDEDQLFEFCRRELVVRTFLETADSTYITARWQFFHGLFFEFCWNATHALEKYLKATLLLNNIKVTRIGHDIEAAFNRAQKNLGADLLPSEFPQALISRIAHITSDNERQKLKHNGPKAYIKALARKGGPNARYAMSSHVIPRTDLYCLDATAFMIRRLSENLQLQEKVDEVKRSPEICPSRSALLETVYSQKNHPLRPVLEKANYFLNPEPDTPEDLPTDGLGMSASNSSLFNHVVGNARSKDPIRNAVAKRLARWALNNLPGIEPYKAALKQYL